jgi:hypothetical protein
VKHINAGVLNVGYVEAGPADGRPVIPVQVTSAICELALCRWSTHPVGAIDACVHLAAVVPLPIK